MIYYDDSVFQLLIGIWYDAMYILKLNVILKQWNIWFNKEH